MARGGESAGESCQDPTFPRLSVEERFTFPEKPEESLYGIDSLVAVGGNLSPGMLLSAYEQGIFPWFSPGDPILWHSPDPRFVIGREDLHVSSSMKKILKQGRFEIRRDCDFLAVIRGCSAKERPGQDGTWITGEMIEAYGELHRLGYAHSSEAWLEGKLVGGCYGLLLGRAFFGESMFQTEPNASKAAFLTLATDLFSQGLQFIDCQVHTDHLESLGAKLIPRKTFLEMLEAALACPALQEAD